MKKILILFNLILGFYISAAQVPVCNATTMIQNGVASSYPASTFVGPNTVDIVGTFIVDVPISINSGCVFKMEEGSEIIVTNGSLLTIDNSVIAKCTRMWKGIKIQSNSAIEVLNVSVIADAEIAIYCEDKTRFTIKDSYILQSIRGVYTPPNASGFNNIIGYVGYSTFGLSAPLAPPYSTQPPHGNTPYAGMDLNNIILTVGDNTTGNNEFGEMNFGIIAHQSILTVTNSKFSTIYKDIAYGNNFYDGAAICAFGGSALYKLTVLPALPFGPSTITQCNFGVYTNAINSSILNTRISSVYRGIYSTGTHNLLSVNVSGCNISAVDYGIDFRFNGGASSMVASENSILMSGNKSGIGINLQDGVNNSISNYKIIENTIDIFDASGGVKCLNTRNTLITYNTIHQFTYGASPFFFGIDLWGLKKPTINCNSVEGIGAITAGTIPSWGIRTNNSNNVIMHCNYVNNLVTGIEFDGPNPSTDLKGNIMHDLLVGFHLNNNALIDHQWQNGNKWTGIYSGGFGATNFNSATQLDVSLNEFDVHTTVGSVYHPSNNLNCGCQWFIQISGNPYDCATQQDCIGFIDGGNDSSEKVTDFDRKIALNQIYTADWQPESRSMTKQYLCNKLQDNDSLVEIDTLMGSFFNSIGLNEYKKIKSIRDKLFSIRNYNIASNNLISSSTIIIDSISQLILQNNNIILSGGLNAPNLLIINDSLINQINLIESLISNLFHQNDSLKLILANDAFAINSQIGDTDIVAANEKLVNTVALATVEIDNYFFTANQIESLIYVANQCPFAGGEAVSRARAIYALINDTIQYNDSVACIALGIFRISDSFHQVSPKVNINPNPITDNATINYNFSNNAILQIYSLTGIPILKYSLPASQTSFNFSTTELANGMYFYSINIDAKNSINGKIIISK